MSSSARRGRRAVAGAIGAGALASAMFFRCRRDRTGPAATASSAAVHDRQTGARDVRCLVRHVELPIHPPRRERVLHQPQKANPGIRSGIRYRVI